MLMRIFILSIVLALSGSSTSAASELLIITAKGSSEPHLNKKKIANIFLREQLINQQGERWIPVNLSIHHPLREAFSETLFNQLPNQMDNFWNIKYFNGISPPYVVKSQEAMLRFVASTPNAIGYILPCFVNDNVTVVFKLVLKTKVKFNVKDICRQHKR